jgi:hypothetical protein
MSGNDWHFRAACAGFVKCAFKLVDGWENVQQEGEDALNDEEVSFYAGDVSSKISFEIKPVFFDQINHGKTRCLILIHFASHIEFSLQKYRSYTCYPPEKTPNSPRQESEGEEEEDLSPTHQVVEDVKAVESKGATDRNSMIKTPPNNRYFFGRSHLQTTKTTGINDIVN